MTSNTFRFLLATGFVSALLALPACRTTVYGPDRCQVEVQSDGTVQVDGKACRFEDIPKRLKSIGFEESDMVRVSVPDGVQRATLSKISSVLASGGYARFVFLKPLQKESFAKEKEAKPPTKPTPK